MQNQFLVTPYVFDQPEPRLEQLVRPGWQVNRPALPEDGSRLKRMSTIHHAIADFTTRALKRGERPVSLAGDCCCAIGLLAGVQRAGHFPTLVWLDAHGDFNTGETSPSGYIGGMPLAMIVGRGDQALVDGVGLERLAESRVFLTDARSLDPLEQAALEGSQVTHLPDVSQLLSNPRLEDPLVVHFDVDITNPQDAPSVGYRTPGGPSAARLRGVFEALNQKFNILAVSLASWDTQKDTDHRTQAVSLDLLYSLIT